MEAGRCQTTITARFFEDADPCGRSLPQPRTYTCDRKDGDWHMIHRDPERGLWKATAQLPNPMFPIKLD